MPDFSFELEKSTNENIEDFFKHMKEEDPDFAAILETNLMDLIHKLNDERLKQQARKEFNNVVINFLDK